MFEPYVYTSKEAPSMKATKKENVFIPSVHHRAKRLSLVMLFVIFVKKLGSHVVLCRCLRLAMTSLMAVKDGVVSSVWGCFVFHLCVVKLHQNITKLWKALKCESWLFTTTLKSLRKYKLLSLLFLHSCQMFSRSLLSIYCISTQMYCKSCLASRKGEKRKRNDHWKWRNVLHRNICPVYLLLSVVWRSISEICWNSIAVWSLWCGSPDRWWRQEVTIPPQSRRQLWDVERLTGKENFIPRQPAAGPSHNPPTLTDSPPDRLSPCCAPCRIFA